MEKYWLVLNPDTFLWVKQKKGYIYNTINHRNITFVYERTLKNIVDKLLEIDNLYRVYLDESTINEPEVNTFIQNIINTESGDLISDNGHNKRPVSLKPVIKLQDSAEYYQWEHKLNIDGDVLHNLHQIVFYINGSSSGHKTYFKQTLYPVTTEQTLDKNKICWFAFNARKSSFLSEISLVGNIWMYPEADMLIQELKDMNHHVVIYATEHDVLANSKNVDRYVTNDLLHILVTDTDIAELLLKNKICRKDTPFTFLISSEQTYENAEECINKYNLENADILPLYTGENLSFFEENLFISEEDISNISLSKRDILARQVLNINNFGKLFILPDGKVHANVNTNPIGNITESPHEMVYKEITESKSWLQVRNEKPCIDCVYQWLCPSPSNFESIFGKPNLCNIKV